MQRHVSYLCLILAGKYELGRALHQGHLHGDLVLEELGKIRKENCKEVNNLLSISTAASSPPLNDESLHFPAPSAELG